MLIPEMYEKILKFIIKEPNKINRSKNDKELSSKRLVKKLY